MRRRKGASTNSPIGLKARTPEGLSEAARKEALQEQNYYRQLYESILNSAGNGILGLDTEGKTVFVNPAAEAMLGYSADELLDNPQHALIHHSRADGSPYPRERCPNHASLRDGEVHRVSGEVFWRKDGTSFPVEYISTPIREQGAIIGTVISFQDISERMEKMRMQRAMVTALKDVAHRTAELRKAEELNRLKDLFLSTISHEIKTPLSLIVGYTELLEDHCKHTPIVQGIKEGSRRLTEHIDNILDYSALLSGTLPLYQTEVNLAEVAGHLQAILEGALHGKQQELVVEVAPDTPSIHGDSRRITQMLLKLLENAVKFTPPGGRIGLRIGPDGDQVRLDVWDTGPGIPEQDFARIWEAFSQASTGNAAPNGGLGLGLTIVKKLVELHGGRVGVVSQVGKGTTFTIFLPIEARADAPETSRPQRGKGTSE